MYQLMHVSLINNLILALLFGAVPAVAHPSSSSGNLLQQNTGTIVIVKDAQPNDPQDFKFFGGDLQVAPFFLDDDNDPTLSNQITFTNVDPGLHFVQEDQDPAGWDLTDITCDDPDNGSFIFFNNREAVIEVDANETITCTFTNTKQGQPTTGTIVIVKDAVPNDAQDFEFVNDVLGQFFLDDDSDPTL